MSKNHPKVPVKIFFRFRILQTAQITPAPQIQGWIFISQKQKEIDFLCPLIRLFFFRCKDIQM